MMSRILLVVFLLVAAASCQSAPTYTEGLPKVPSNFNISDYLIDVPIPPGGAPDVVGAFRFICNPSHLSYDDPIVFPGKPGSSHLHQWYGNTAANGNSTYESLRQTGNSTCANIINRSAYWMPAMMNGKGGVVRPDYISIYYKNNPKTDSACQSAGIACIPLPRGLRFVFGYDMINGTPRTGAGYFNCDGPTATPGHYANIIEAGKNCPAGNKFGAVINAPNCWDGKNLDSPNHRSHVTFTSYGSWGYPKCPETHPWIIPSFTLGAWYTVDENLDHSGEWNNKTNSPSTWYLSSDVNEDGSMHTPGSTYHADWFGAWDDDGMKMWQDNCIDKLLNCAAGDLGNGKQMKGFPEFSWEANPRVVPVPVNPVTGKLPVTPTQAPTQRPVVPAEEKSSDAVKISSFVALSLFSLVVLI